MVHKFIKKAIKRPGAFTKKAKSAGMSVAAFAKKVLKKGSSASTRTKRQASLAKTLRRFAKTRIRPATRRPRHAGPPKVGFRTVKGRRGKRITIKRPSPRLVGPAFTGRRNPIQRPGISGNPRRRGQSA